jgi:hypothetical protein
MVMVIRQAIGIDLNLPEPGHVGEQVEKSLPPFVFDDDITAGLATVHDGRISRVARTDSPECSQCLSSGTPSALLRINSVEDLRVSYHSEATDAE